MVAKFPKNQRFLISNNLLQANLEMIKLTIIANSKPNRIEEQNQISLNLDLFRIYVRIAKDLNFISIKKYEYVAELINEIGRMLTAWKKTTEK